MKFNENLYRKEKHWKEGEFDVYRNMQWTGPGCHEGCGVLFYVKDGKVDHIEGDPNDEFSRGRLCMRCLNMVDEAINNPTRLGHPLKRVGKRGENKWEQISWDEAYDMIEEHVRAAWDEIGPEAIVALEGTGRNVVWQIPLLEYSAFKSPNFGCGFLSGDSCYLPRCSASVGVMGGPAVVDCGQYDPRRYDNPEYKFPEVILQWGCNAVKTNADGFLGHWLVDCMKEGGSKLINVDPRVTWMGSRAEYNIQPRPGTDAAVAMAMINVIIEEDLYDHDFVENWCYGFDALRDEMKDKTPEWAAEIAWVDAEDIRGAARLYASGKPSAFHWGLSTDMTPNGVGQAHAFMVLEGITGNVDVPGGNYLATGPYGVDALYGCGYNYFISPELQEKRIGVEKYPMHKYGAAACAVGDEILLQLETEQPYQIKVMYLAGTNPIVNMAAEAPCVYKAMLNCPFIVVADMWMTPTATACADLVLPVAMSCERDSFREWWTPSRAITKITQYEEAKSDEEILVDLSLRLNGDNVPWHDVESLLNWVLAKDNAPRTWTELKDMMYEYNFQGYRRYESGKLRPDGQPGFNTMTGKLELQSCLLGALGYHDLPYFEEPPESPVSAPELYKEYPLVLTTGKRHWEFFHSEHRNMPTMREFRPEPTFDINPVDAEKYGIEDGQWVWIENQRGRCRQIAHLVPTMKEGTICADHGWSFPETEEAVPNLQGIWDVNINNLTTQCVVGETGYGAPYRCLLCKIYPVTEENSKVTPTQVVAQMIADAE